MGRVFTFEKLSSGEYPQPEDFERAVDVFQDLTSQYPRNVIDGAFIYGSVAIGAANKRSDLDLFFSVGEPSHIGAVRHVVRRVHTETEDVIPIVPIVQTRPNLEAARHEMDRFFGQHLSSEHRIIVGNDPAEYVTYSQEPAYDIMARYIAQKRRRLTNAFIGKPDEIENGGLQRMLELPTAIARKALQALAEVDKGVEPVEKSADKAELARRGLELMQDYGLADTFEQIIRIDGQYTNLLGLYARDPKAYSGAIISMHNELFSALKWLGSLESVLLSDLHED